MYYLLHRIPKYNARNGAVGAHRAAANAKKAQGKHRRAMRKKRYNRVSVHGLKLMLCAHIRDGRGARERETETGNYVYASWLYPPTSGSREATLYMAMVNTEIRDRAHRARQPYQHSHGARRNLGRTPWAMVSPTHHRAAPPRLDHRTPHSARHLQK